MDSTHARKLIRQALEALEEGAHVRALALGDQLTQAMPNDAQVRAIRAEALLAGDSSGDEALEEARTATRLEPFNFHAHLLVARAAWKAERLTLAQQSYERALEYSGRMPELLSEYAWFMAQERGPRPAEEIASEAVDADEESATAWAALGVARHRLHRYREAEDALRRAMDLAPDDPRVQAAMVVLLQDQRKTDQAAPLIDSLSRIPGAEEFAAAARREGKRRQVESMLLERGVDPSPAKPHNAWRIAAWLTMTSIIVGLMTVIALVSQPGPMFVALLIAVLVGWWLRGWFD